MQKILSKDIDGWEDYTIDSNGNVFSKRNKKYLKPNIDKSGYLYYVISVNGKRATFKAHRLVAKAFIPNLENKPTVDHIDNNRLNNNIENLRWATAKEQKHNEITHNNMTKIYTSEYMRKMGEKRNFGRKTAMAYKDGKEVARAESLLVLCESLGLNYSKASEVAHGKRKRVGEYVIRFPEE